MSILKYFFGNDNKKEKECLNEIRFHLIVFKEKYRLPEDQPNDPFNKRELSQKNVNLPLYGLHNILDELKEFHRNNWVCLQNFFRLTKSWKIDAEFCRSIRLNSNGSIVDSFLKDIDDLQNQIILTCKKHGLDGKIIR